MKSERIPTRVAARAACSCLIAAILLAAPTNLAASGDGTDDGCGMAEACLVMSPSPDSRTSTGARRTVRDRKASVQARDRGASRKVSASKKVALSTPTLIATDLSTAEVPRGEPNLVTRRIK